MIWKWIQTTLNWPWHFWLEPKTTRGVSLKLTKILSIFFSSFSSLLLLFLVKIGKQMTNRIQVWRDKVAWKLTETKSTWSVSWAMRRTRGSSWLEIKSQEKKEEERQFFQVLNKESESNQAKEMEKTTGSEIKVLLFVVSETRHSSLAF